jgi:hypothetical protein
MASSSSFLSFVWEYVAREPPREPPPFPIEDLPPELQRMIARRTGLRPLLRLAQANEAFRVHVDRIFVHLFNRDIWAYVAWPTYTESEKKLKEAVREQLLEERWAGVVAPPTLQLTYASFANPVPQYFYYLLFLGAERTVPRGQARQQKLRLCDVYRRTCWTLAAGFVNELLYALQRSNDMGIEMQIVWIDPEMSSRYVAAKFTPPVLLPWPFSKTLSFVASAPELLPHVAVLNGLAPTLARVKKDEEITKAWQNAFINLLLDVCMRLESNTDLGMVVRRFGLATMVRPMIMRKV